MRFDIVSLFPEMFEGPLGSSILKRARAAGHIEVAVTNPRDFTYDKHRIVDDYPFGGGAGMVMKPEPIFRTVEHILSVHEFTHKRILLMCPGGEPFTQAKAKELAQYQHLVILCGHYEGIDERVRVHLVDEAISVGDYVLTGGELPAMIIVDAVSRMLPGVLGATHGASQDSFYNGLLEHPQYTRPRTFNGWDVPEVLVSGDHAKIERWRKQQSLKNTLVRRPDLLDEAQLSKEDLKILTEIKKELEGEE